MVALDVVLVLISYGRLVFTLSSRVQNVLLKCQNVLDKTEYSIRAGRRRSLDAK